MRTCAPCATTAAEVAIPAAKRRRQVRRLAGGAPHIAPESCAALESERATRLERWHGGLGDGCAAADQQLLSQKNCGWLGKLRRAQAAPQLRLAQARTDVLKETPNIDPTVAARGSIRQSLHARLRVRRFVPGSLLRRLEHVLKGH